MLDTHTQVRSFLVLSVSLLMVLGSVPAAGAQSGVDVCPEIQDSQARDVDCEDVEEAINEQDPPTRCEGLKACDQLREFVQDPPTRCEELTSSSNCGTVRGLVPFIQEYVEECTSARTQSAETLLLPSVSPNVTYASSQDVECEDVEETIEDPPECEDLLRECNDPGRIDPGQVCATMFAAGGLGGSSESILSPQMAATPIAEECVPSTDVPLPCDTKTAPESDQDVQNGQARYSVYVVVEGHPCQPVIVTPLVPLFSDAGEIDSFPWSYQVKGDTSCKKTGENSFWMPIYGYDYSIEIEVGGTANYGGVGPSVGPVVLGPVLWGSTASINVLDDTTTVERSGDGYESKTQCQADAAADTPGAVLEASDEASDFVDGALAQSATLSLQAIPLGGGGWLLDVGPLPSIDVTFKFDPVTGSWEWSGDFAAASLGGGVGPYGAIHGEGESFATNPGLLK